MQAIIETTVVTFGFVLRLGVPLLFLLQFGSWVDHRRQTW